MKIRRLDEASKREKPENKMDIRMDKSKKSDSRLLLQCNDLAEVVELVDTPS